METLSAKEIKELSYKDPYYAPRVGYLNAVIDILSKIKFSSALELGPYHQPIIKSAHTMDRADFGTPPTYIHNACKFPWPIENNKYDLFMALQVWEHLEGNQQKAFMEVMRISRKALLSFPYKWHCPGNCHHNITEQTISDWTLGTPPLRIAMVKAPNVQDRVIYYFDFELKNRIIPPQVLS